jgi:glycosyltransferase involved in cell wall biosynthesis
LRVLHVTPATFGDDGIFGGGERFPYELARAMARHVPTKLLSFGATRRVFMADALEVEILPTRFHVFGGSLNPFSERLLPELWGATVLHAHQYETTLSNLAVLMSMATRRRAFATDHGGRSRHLGNRLHLDRFLDGFLAVSAFSASLFPRLQAKTEVILGGVDPARYFPTDQARARKAIFVGRMLPHKGIDVLIRSTPPDLPLHLYGRSYDDAYTDRLLQMARSRDVSFHFTASDDEILAAYRSARVCVLPSLLETSDGQRAERSELLGLTLLEAMACGTPVIASNVGGMPEVVRDGITGRIVEPGNVVELADALVSIVDGGSRWHAMSKAAAESVRSEFTWDRVALRCLAAYERSSRR